MTGLPDPSPGYGQGMSYHQSTRPEQLVYRDDLQASRAAAL